MKEEGRRKKEEGRGKREEGRGQKFFLSCANCQETYSFVAISLG
ncbi:hypothetical protein [Microcoleus sp. POL10_C6]